MKAERGQPGRALLDPAVLIRGAGEMASAIACRLYRAHLRRLCMLDLPHPLAVRRQVAFSPALHAGQAVVEGVVGRAAETRAALDAAWADGCIAVMPVAAWQAGAGFAPEVAIDAILAKRNLATRIDDAPLVIALGPGFTAGVDCHLVVETQRGHHLGRVLEVGSAAPNTGEPGPIAGVTHARVLRAPVAGRFTTRHDIGDCVAQGDVVAQVDGVPVVAGVGGVLRGLLVDDVPVSAGLKLGDIDPRGDASYCATISDKARALSGAVLECVLRHCNVARGGA